MRGAATFVGLLGGGLALVVGCGGPAFTVEQSGDDASADDGGASADALQEPPASCSGDFACVPAVPGGWTGPVERYSGASPAPPCTTSFASSSDGNDQLDAPPASCGCQCGPAQVPCTPSQVDLFDVPACAAPACAHIQLVPGACTAVPLSPACTGAAGIFMTAAAPASGGSCTPQPTRSVPPVAWGVTGRSCASAVAAAQVDCAQGSICAPRAKPPYAGTLCIAAPGDVPCPSAGYTSKHRAFGAVNDDRDCTACACGDVVGATCSAKIDVYGSANGSCSNGSITYAVPFTCAGVSDPADFRLSVTTGGGSCTPSPSNATGAATPAKPTTYCCLP